MYGRVPYFMFESEGWKKRKEKENREQFMQHDVDKKMAHTTLAQANRHTHTRTCTHARSTSSWTIGPLRNKITSDLVTTVNRGSPFRKKIAVGLQID